MSGPALSTYIDEDRDRILAWARYVFYAEIECEQYNAHEMAEDESPIGRTLVLMMQFYAALWVVAEGWQDCPLTDETIDELLTDPAFEQNVTLLRRFRNGVYHYQPQQINEKVLAFLRDGSEHAIAWAFLLHDEFKRVVWELAHPRGVSPSQQIEIADSLRGIIGWLPSDLPEAQPLRAAEQYREVAAMVLKDGSRNTPHARELLDAVNHVRATAHDAAAGWTAHKRAMIEALKKQKRMGLDT
ncbi:MAG TPA: hypothetical protein VN700_09265 [Vicinamibacterales bacterium]|nr:hypothetical protein [Vicinamibacterales bacterium]